MAAPKSSTHTGWHNDTENSRLEFYYRGTKVGHLTGTTFVLAAGVAVSLTDTGLTVTSGGLTVTAGGLTVTADGLTVTAGGATITAGDATLVAAGAAFVAAVGNVELGAPAVFATTQPQGAVHMGGSSLSGIAPVGATVTSGAVFASDTVVRKIIAAGTASNVET